MADDMLSKSCSIPYHSSRICQAGGQVFLNIVNASMHSVQHIALRLLRAAAINMSVCGHAGGAVQLLKGLDSNKDQSYFLASVPATALQHFVFPLGNMLKPDVRQLAAAAGLSSAARRSSAGVCFIGQLTHQTSGGASFVTCLKSVAPACP